MAIQKFTRVEKMLVSTNKLIVQVMNLPAADYAELLRVDGPDPVSTLMDMRSKLMGMRDKQCVLQLGGGEGV